MSTFNIPGAPSTSVPDLQFTPQGVIVPSDADILAGVQVDINFAFGGGLNPALTTPQGQLASSTTAIVSDKDAAILYVTNQVDPQYSTGRFQDAIARIYFLTRLPAVATAVNCVLGGLPNTVIPVGTLARDTAGNTYSLLGNVTIGSGSTANSEWQNVVTGPIPCNVGTLTKVYQAIPGWDTINNPADGILGRVVESPQEFELRRQNSVAVNANGSTQAILGVVAEVPGVLAAYVIDNPQGQIINTGSTNYPMKPNSLYVAVVGGLDADIAQAIWSRKDTGCSYNGNTTFTVFDMSPQYSSPYPAYPVTFNRPTSTPVLFAVSLVNSGNLPSNITALVQAAIINQFNGTDNQVPARIGAAVTGSSYYAAIVAISTNITVLSILVGISAPTMPQVIMGIDQAPVIDASDISVTLV